MFPDPEHSAREERHVNVAHREPGERHVAVRGQEHRDLDAAPGRVDQGAQHLAVGQEISLRKLDGRARPAERLEVASPQPPAAAAIGEVDADGAPRVSDPLPAQLAREPRAGVAPDLGDEVGPADGATVDAVLVADVDATHERDALVDEEELAVIARERAEQEPPAPGVNADRAAGGGQLCLDLVRVLRRAPSVERDAHVDTAGSGGRQRRDEAPARRVEAEQVHLQLHGLSRLLDGQDHARKRLDTAVEQSQVLRGLHRTAPAMVRRNRAPPHQAPLVPRERERSSVCA